MKTANLVLVIIAFLVFPCDTVPACSTFMMEFDQGLYFGHNLDMPYEIPGLIFINPRGIARTAVSWQKLISGSDQEDRDFLWVSRYFSITFNPLGRDFPDGGINEMGLYIQEMTLVNTRFPYDEEKPTLFMMLWMQYILDSFGSVRELLQNLEHLNLDGWGWHFFIADRSGDAAVLEFIDGQSRIYHDRSLPYPVLCNEEYERELSQLGQYKGYGGNIPIETDTVFVSRFARAVNMLEMADLSADAVKYGFEILSALDTGRTQWSYLIDPVGEKIVFRTSLGKQLKTIDYKDLDFCCPSEILVYDINSTAAGPILDRFTAYNMDINRSYVEQGVKTLDQEGALSAIVLDFGVDLESFIKRIWQYPGINGCLQRIDNR